MAVIGPLRGWGLSMNLRFANVQHSTSNLQRSKKLALKVERWTLDVERFRFMVPMRVCSKWEAFHEPSPSSSILRFPDQTGTEDGPTGAFSEAPSWPTPNAKLSTPNSKCRLDLEFGVQGLAF